MTEEWRPIQGADGYEVSNLGRVRCWRPIPHTAPPPTEPRIVKPSVNRKGYQKVSLGFGGRTPMLHRLVAEAFVAGREEGLEAAHSNGDKSDNRAVNLEWKTSKENHADKRTHGTSGKKLTIEDARAIRKVYDTGELTQTEVGRMFGITQGTVGKIVRNELWAEVV